MMVDRRITTSLLLAVGISGIAGWVSAQESGYCPAPASVRVATIGGKTITAAELDAMARDRLIRVRNEEYTVRRQVLDEYLTRLLLEQEAAGRGVTVQELTRVEIDANVAPVTDEQARAILESRGARNPGQTEAQALAQIEGSLRQTRRTEARRRFVDGLRTKSGVQILLEAPRASVSVANAPSKGPATAPVTIVEFSDFQCPYCRSVTETLRKLQARYADQVRIVYRDFPLPNHKEAPKAAEAAACAHEQGRFWEMHDKLFDNQSGLQVPDLKRRAAEIGLNTVRFDECLDSGKFSATWQQNRTEGQGYGVSATPTFFINGRMITGARPLEAFAEIIDEELARVTNVAAR